MMRLGIAATTLLGTQASLIGEHSLKLGHTLHKLSVSEQEDTTQNNRHPLKFDFTSE